MKISKVTDYAALNIDQRIPILFCSDSYWEDAQAALSRCWVLTSFCCFGHTIAYIMKQ